MESPDAKDERERSNMIKIPNPNPKINSFNKTILQKLSDYEDLINALKIEEFKRKTIKMNWCDCIMLMEILTRKNLRKYNILNYVIIIGGVLIPVTINIIEDDYLAKAIPTLLGVLVGIAASLNQSYRYNDKWKHFREISERLKIEGEHYLSLSGNYRLFENHDNEAYRLFMNNIGLIKESQISDYFKLIVNNEIKDKENKEKIH